MVALLTKIEFFCISIQSELVMFQLKKNTLVNDGDIKVIETEF